MCHVMTCHDRNRYRPSNHFQEHLHLTMKLFYLTPTKENPSVFISPTTKCSTWISLIKTPVLTVPDNLHSANMITGFSQGSQKSGNGSFMTSASLSKLPVLLDDLSFSYIISTPPLNFQHSECHCTG